MGTRRGCLNLRGNLGDAGFRNAVAAVTGVEPPVESCTWRRAGDAAVYWLGPDEWLLVLPAGREADVERQLRDALAASFSIVGTSGTHCFLNLSGPASGYVLQKSSARRSSSTSAAFLAPVGGGTAARTFSGC